MKTIKTFKYCQSQIEGFTKCSSQCEHCNEYYAPLEKESEFQPRRFTGLTDKGGYKIMLGSVVELTRSRGCFQKGGRFRCVWNVPQHRYGFVYITSTNMGSKDYDDNFVTHQSDCHFYVTPNNVKHLRIVV